MGHQYLSRAEVPDCCHGCIHLDWDSQDEYSNSYYYCLKGVFFPTKKQTCKKRDSGKLPNPTQSA